MTDTKHEVSTMGLKASKTGNEPVNVKEMLALEEELISLKKKHGIEDKCTWWKRLGDRLVDRLDRETRTISRKQYIKLALCGGWLCGAHRFYAHQKAAGSLYLLFCWTGIPFAMTLIDLMIVVPMKTDEAGMIQI